MESKYTRQNAIEKLLDGYAAYYNITRFPKEEKPLTALCEFFEHSEKYVLSRKAELWSADCEEFIYVFDMEVLTKELFEKCIAYVKEDGLKKADIKQGHMYTYITPIFICDTYEDIAVKTLKKYSFYKSFHFSLHGWAQINAAALALANDEDCIIANKSGRYAAKVMKKILFSTKKKGRFF